jgi:hypothetical protein
MYTWTHGLDQMIQDPESGYGTRSTDLSNYMSDRDSALAR